jgi:pyruvate/2-oxoglutarate dehydrogenase complex dihydrolipoamide acyltransferase (E2) component
VATSPAIRRRAKEAGIDLSIVPGSGVGGRIQRHDFDNYLKSLALGSQIAKASNNSTSVN